MARPRKHPEPLVRLQPYLRPGAAKWLHAKSEAEGVPVGEVIENLIHEASTPTTSPRRHLVPNMPHIWKVDKLNRNVCGNCGGQKIAVNGQPCPGVPE